MSSWRECKLGDVIDVKHGYAFKGENITTEKTSDILVTPGNFNIGGGFKSSKFKYFNGNYPEDYIFSEGDIVVTMTDLSKEGDTLGYSAKIPKCEDCKYLHNQRVGLVKFISNDVYKDFIYWLMRTREYQSFIVGAATGTSIRHTSPKLIKEYAFELPPLEEQKAIAEVLSSLDDKIDLLHRQNQTLESLAQTLFRQWFEDKEFDGIIGDIIKLQSGYAFKSKDFQDFGIHGVLKIKNISNSIIDIFNTDFIDLTVANKTDEKFKILSGDILFGMTGAEIGKMGIVPKTDKNLWLNQRVGVLREKYLGAKYLAYLQLTSEFGFDYITNTATGSAQPNISASEIEQCPFVKLEVDEIENYSNEISPLFEKIIFNLGQIQTLENLRDTLLPKLLSGEVRVEI